MAKARETSITLESALAILTEHASAEEFRRRLNMDLAAGSEDNEDVMTVHVAMKQARPWLSAPKCAVLPFEITHKGVPLSLQSHLESTKDLLSPTHALPTSQGSDPPPSNTY